MADSGHPPAELHERLLICRTIKLNAGAHGGHRRCCHAQMQKNAQNKPQIARLILCVHTTLQVYCNLFLTFCLGGGFSQFFIVNGANCPIKTKNPRIPAWFRFGRSALADDLLRRAEDHVIDVEALEVFKLHVGSHAPFSFQFQGYDTTSLSSVQVWFSTYFTKIFSLFCALC